MTLIQTGGEYFRFRFNRQGNREKGNVVLLLSSPPAPRDWGRNTRVQYRLAHVYNQLSKALDHFVVCVKMVRIG